MIRILKKIGVTAPFPISRKYSSIDDTVTVQKIGHVTCIGINRPQNKNCLNVKLLTQLKSALNSYENDSASLAGVLYGVQGSFSHGIDSSEISDLSEIQLALEQITGKFFVKPLIAAISGFAVGPGFDLALCCDFRIVEDTAVIAAFARTFGVPLNDITAKRLSSLVGTHRALDWVLTGRPVKAKEALDCGIATRVVACGTALGQAVNFASTLCNMPQACLRADRATLLSLSEKFSSPEVKEVILAEKKKNMNIALEEVKQGVHITESGDVRRKDHEYMKNWNFEF